MKAKNEEAWVQLATRSPKKLHLPPVGPITIACFTVSALLGCSAVPNPVSATRGPGGAAWLADEDCDRVQQAIGQHDPASARRSLDACRRARPQRALRQEEAIAALEREAKNALERDDALDEIERANAVPPGQPYACHEEDGQHAMRCAYAGRCHRDALGTARCPYPGPPHGFTARNVACAQDDHGEVSCHCKRYGYDTEADGYPYAVDDPACAALAKLLQPLEQKAALARIQRVEEAKAASNWWALDLHTQLGSAKATGRCEKSIGGPAEGAATMRGMMFSCQMNNDVANGVVVLDCTNRFGHEFTTVYTHDEATCTAMYARFK